MKKPIVLSSVVSLMLILAAVPGDAPAGAPHAGTQNLLPPGPPARLSPSVKVDADFGNLPVYFIPNRGQLDEHVAYYVQGKDKTVYFTNDGMTLSLAKPTPLSGDAGAEVAERWTVKLDFVGADPDVRPVGETETGAVVSYFKGKAAEWKTGLPTYSRIVYRDLWPGIDLAYCGTVGRLKYEFIVQPGADPSQVRLAYRGTDGISVDSDGRLEVVTPLGGFSDDVPVAYQDKDGERTPIRLAYKLDASEAGKSVYGFEVGAYEPSLPLVLDPALLIYSGFLGGSSADAVTSVAVDVWGDAYVAGYTDSPQATFPLTAGPDLTANGSTDAFVAKINPAGTALMYCGYIGGASADLAYGIAVDTAGYAYVTGHTSSDQTTFPVIYGPDLTFNFVIDAFVAKLNVAGTALLYCGYIGTADTDFGWGIALDGSGCAYVGGYTTTATNQADAFVAKVTASGSGLAYYKTIAASGHDRCYAIAVDGSGCAYITGQTTSTDLPVTVGPDLMPNGNTDAFVAKVNASGSGLVYCGYLGGSGVEDARGIAVDILGNAYVTGYTGSDQTTFPLVGGPGLTYKGSNDAFVAKVSPGGGYLIYCGYIGGSGADGGQGIAVDISGNAYIVGTTNSTEATFPVAAGPDLTANGSNDAFVAKVNASATGLIYCGYIGGSALDSGLGIAVGASGNAFATGLTSSTEATFPVTAGPDLTQNGAEDGFVAKIYYFEQPVRNHAVGDFDGDGADEVAMDFGSTGAWMWNAGTWSQLTAYNPENMVAFDIDGNGDKEIAVDLGALGLWMWNGGVWSQLTASDPEYLIAVDTNGNGVDELILDFGAAGVKWRQENGTLTTIAPFNPQNLIAADIDGDGKQQVVGDFGAVGVWRWEASGPSTHQLTPADASAMAAVDAFGSGNQGVAAGLLGFGVWYWQNDIWTQLSGVTADQIIAGQMILGVGEEIACDFGLLGMWLGSGAGWTQLSGVNADDMIAADTNGDGVDEVAGDFGPVGLWLRTSGAWTELSGVDPEGLLAGDVDGDGAKELIVDFGTLGVWLWNAGAWDQISGVNPD